MKSLTLVGLMLVLVAPPQLAHSQSAGETKRRLSKRSRPSAIPFPTSPCTTPAARR